MTKPTLLLVHGGWSGAWVWEPLASALNARKTKWKAIDCLGYASKKRFGWAVSANDVADDIVSEAQCLSGPVLLVGHSSGGMAVSRAAAKAPDEFVGLVYLCAFLPRDGDRLLRLLAHNEGSNFASLTKPNLLKGMLTLDQSRLRDYFFHDCTEQDFEHASARFGGEPIRLGTAKTALNDGFERLPKHYLGCTADRVLSPAFQKWMVARQPVTSYTELPTGHMPMYSDPSQLADRLVDVADTYPAPGTH